jgi:phenylalanyl-tRNA synthetase beta chain
MLVSLNWLREFVDVPAGLDPRELAERFTVATAEVEGVEHVTRLPEGVRFGPGERLDEREREDWIIEIDNKSITHRPDLWGHYGIAREIAAILGTPLKPYPVTPAEQLGDPRAREIPIVIDDPQKCPRYTGLLITFAGRDSRGTGCEKGFSHQRPSPPWMQVRLARCGMRPIDLIVDLTNYVMLELGQPMHAFDGGKLDRIEVAAAAPGERFRTLDAVEREMPPGTLMIQCGRKSVAIGGVMGGAETEVSLSTTTVLLESANFDAATIRRAASAMGLRTEASARFEKSLDPAYTVLGIGRFVYLARNELPNLGFASRLSDCFPRPLVIEPIEVDPAFAARFIGKDVPVDEMARILRALEFEVESRDGRLRVKPPTFRATRDIRIEADVIEEIARFVGYGNIEPALPRVTTRYLGEAADLRLERQTLDYFCAAGDFAEVHGYIWYDDEWLARLGFDPGECLTLRNPAAAGCGRFRRTLIPGLLRAVERNRHHFQCFQIAEVGSVFQPESEPIEQAQQRHLALAVARAGAGDEAWQRLKRYVEGWARQLFDTAVSYAPVEGTSTESASPLASQEPRGLKPAAPLSPWEDPVRVAVVNVAGRPVGRVCQWSMASRLRIDERLRAWSAALAEINLSALVDCVGRYEKRASVPKHPRVRLDFSCLADARRRYAQIADDMASFEHPLLRRLTFEDSYEGGSVPAGKRSLLFRAELGLSDRTLTDDDLARFRDDFTRFLHKLRLELRG